MDEEGILDRNSVTDLFALHIFTNQEFKLLLINLRKAGTITQSPQKKAVPHTKHG